MIRTSPRPRSGSMLVELMVVLPIFATLLVLAIGWIHQSMTLASTMRDRQRHHRHLLLLARQLRDDVHRATEIQRDGPETLTFALDDASHVTYRLSGRRIMRRLSRQADAADSAHQRPSTGSEQYELADDSRARWDTSELPKWVTLVVERPRGEVGGEPSPDRTSLGQPPPVPDLHVRAAVGRWRSWNPMTPSGEPASSPRPSEPSSPGDPEAADEPEPGTVSGATDTASGAGR